MKKAFKVLAVLLGLTLAVVLLAFVAIRLYFPPAKVKALLVEQLSRYLHREVQAGDVSLSLLSGLSLSDLKISEHPTFSEGTFVTVKRFSVFIALKPLLRKEIVIRSVVLSEPVIQVVRWADGKTFNFSDLTASTTAQVAQATREDFMAAAVPVPGKTEPGYALQVVNAEIHQGAVHFVDRSPARSNAELSALDLNVKGIAQDKPFPFDVAAHVKTVPFTGDVKIKGVLDWLQGHLILKAANVASKDYNVSATGEVRQLKSDLPAAALNVVVNAYLHPKLKAPIKGSVRVEGTQKQLTFQNLKASLDKLELTGQGRVENVSGPLPALSARFETNTFPVQETLALTAVQLPPNRKLSGSMKWTADIAGTAQEATIKALKLSWGSLQVNAQGRAEKLASPLPVLNMHIETNEFPLQEALTMAAVQLPPDVKATGLTKVSADIAGTSQSARIAAKIQGQKLDIAKGAVFKKPAGVPFDLQTIVQTSQNNTQLTFESLQVHAAGLEMNGSGTYRAKLTGPDLDFKLKTNTFPLADVVKLSPSAVPAQTTLSGQAQLNLQLRGSILAPAAEGALALQQNDIKMPDMELSGLEGTVAFKTPNALAEAAARIFNTSGRLKADHLRHEFYRGQNASVQWDLTDVTEDLSRVSGDMKMSQGEGNILNADKAASHSSFARLLLMPLTVLQKLQAKGVFKQIGLPSFENVPFSGFKGDYALQRGVLEMKPFEFMGRDLNAQVRGTVQLAQDRALNLKGVFRLAPGIIRGTAGEVFKDAMGFVPVPFTVTGTLKDPVSKLDLSSMATTAIQNMGPQLKELGDSLLKEIFKK